MKDRYADIHRAFRWDVPSSFNIGDACCARWANDRSRFALYWEDESGETAAYTYWDLQQRANRLSNALAALGVGRGDRVALMLPQRPETAIAHIVQESRNRLVDFRRVHRQPLDEPWGGVVVMEIPT